MTTRDIVFVALFAAIVAVLGLLPKIQLTAGVPITAQSLGVMLAGGILGARRGGIALLVFIVLVLAGLPLLSGGRGGIGLLAGPSGGFIVAFPVSAFAVGYLTERFWHRLTVPVATGCNIIGGIGLLYLIGIPWMALTTGFGGIKAFLLALPFLPGDVIKATLAAFLTLAIKRVYPIIRPQTL